MPRALFVAMHRLGRAPNQRFRFEQYLDFLQANGFDCEFSPALDAWDDRHFYAPGRYPQKAVSLLKAAARRARDAVRAGGFDVVFVAREAFMLGAPFFERVFKRSGAKLVFDFDDAIWLPNVSEANKAFARLKCFGKTAELVAMADLVLAGNEYLASYARPLNPRVSIVPTTIDTEQYRPADSPRPPGPVCVGWSGSTTTIRHFDRAVPVLRLLREKYGDAVRFAVVGDGSYRNDALAVQGLPWRPETELEDLRAFDVGIMPLPDDDWAKGKCGLKGLQYMALGIPTVMSPVGVNAEIIQDGANGFLAGSTEEWVEKLSRLVESADLRRRLGEAGRRTVVERYSVEAWKAEYLARLREVAPA